MKTTKSAIMKIGTVFALAILMTVVMALVASAATSSVSYYEKSWNSSTETVTSTTKTVTATEVTSSDTSWGTEGATTYYVVNSSTTVGSTTSYEKFYIYGDVHLILNADLKLNQSVSGTGSLYIYSTTTAGAAAKLTMADDKNIVCTEKIEIHGGVIDIPGAKNSIMVGLYAPIVNVYDTTVKSAIVCNHGNENATTRAINIYGGTVQYSYRTDYGASCIGVSSSSSSYPYSIGIYNANIRVENTYTIGSTIIGGGNVTDITIKNSTVRAISISDKSNALAIGSDYDYSDEQSSSITIENSTITAWGGRYGIGGTVKSINLKNSKIEASAGDQEYVNKQIVYAIGGIKCQTLTIDGGYISTDVFKEYTTSTDYGYWADNIIIKGGAVNASDRLCVDGGTITIQGGSVIGSIINEDKETVIPVNESGSSLYPRTITLYGVSDGTALSAAEGITGYAINGTKTIGNQVCLWLPENSVPTSITANGNIYVGVIGSGAKATEAIFYLKHNCADNGSGKCSTCGEIMAPATENGTYLIYDLEDFTYFKKLVEGTLLSGIFNPKANAKLMADVNIGTLTVGTDEMPFRGVLDGNGYTLTATGSTFIVVNGATFKNLIYDDGYSNSNDFIVFPTFSGAPTGYYGGLVTIATGDTVTFENCIVSASYKFRHATSSRTAYDVNFGVFVGYSDADVVINNCAYTGSINMSNIKDISCMVGKSDPDVSIKISNSYLHTDVNFYNSGNIYAFSHRLNNNTVSNCYYGFTMTAGGTGNHGVVSNDATYINIGRTTDFADGTITYKLNKGDPNGAWKQTVGGNTPDTLPNFKGSAVAYNIVTDSYDNHAHAVTYELATVNSTNDSILIKCAGCAADGVYATLTAPGGLVYKPNTEYLASVTNADLVGDIVYYENSTVMDSAPSQAGTYTAKVSVGALTASIEYTVEKADGKVSSISNIGKEYDAAAVGTPTYSSLSGGTVTVEYKKNENESEYSTTAPVDVGKYTVRVTVAADRNYKEASATLNFTITKAPLKITANAHAVSYGDAPANNGVCYDGFKGSDDKAVLGGTLTFSYDYEALDVIGDYVITPSGYTSTNYEISYETGVLTVSKRAVSFTTEDQSITMDESIDGTKYTSTGLVNGHVAHITADGGEILVDKIFDASEDDVTENYSITYASKGTYHCFDVKYTSDGKNHWYACTVEDCSEAKGTDACKGGYATCSSSAICNICKRAYGTTNYFNHSYTVYVSDENATAEADGTKTALCDYGCGNTDSVTEPGSRLEVVASGFESDSIKSSDREELDSIIGEIDELLESDNLTESERNDLENAKAEAEALVSDIEAVAAEKTEVEESVASYESKSIKSSDKENLNALIGDIDALLETDKLTDEEKTELEAAKAEAEALIVSIDANAENKSDTESAVASYESETVKSSDKEGLESLVDDIDTLLATENYTDEEKAELEAAKADAEALIANIATNTEAKGEVENSVISYESETVKSSDKESLESLIGDIDALLATENYTTDEKAELESAKVEVEELIVTIEATAGAKDELDEKLSVYTTENVKLEDAENITALVGEIDILLADENYTADEKAELESAKAEANALLETIETNEANRIKTVTVTVVVIVVVILLGGGTAIWFFVIRRR